MSNIEITPLMLREDMQFLHDRLSLVPASNRLNVKMTYKRKFIEGMQQEGSPIKRHNAGRYAANSWLYDITERLKCET